MAQTFNSELLKNFLAGRQPAPEASTVANVPGIENVTMANAPVLPPVDFNAPARPDGTQAFPFGGADPRVETRETGNRLSGLTQNLVPAPERIVAAPRFGGSSPDREMSLPTNTAQGRGNIASNTPAPVAAGVRSPSVPQDQLSGADVSAPMVEPQAPSAMAPQMPQNAPQGLTTVGGTPLSEFLSGAAIPERGLVASNPLEGRGISPSAEEWEERSAMREARAAEQFGRARGPDSRGLSERDENGMTQGDRRNILREQGIGGSAQVAIAQSPELFAARTRTPQPESEADQESQRLANERTRQIIEQGNKPDATPEEKRAAARQKGVQDGTITQAQADEANKRDLIGNPPAGYATWAEYEADTGIDADGDGKVATPEEAAQAAEENNDPLNLGI